MKILLITLVILGLAGIDGWPLIRDARWKELTVHTAADAGPGYNHNGHGEL